MIVIGQHEMLELGVDVTHWVDAAESVRNSLGIVARDTGADRSHRALPQASAA